MEVAAKAENICVIAHVIKRWKWKCCQAIFQMLRGDEESAQMGKYIKEIYMFEF